MRHGSASGEVTEIALMSQAKVNPVRSRVTEPGEITQLLVAWSGGDEGALPKLVINRGDELRRLAHRYMSRERAGHSLQTTALVHETYARLAETPDLDWKDRIHFFAVCAQMMRRILVDHSRSRNSLKRGCGVRLASLDEALSVSCTRPPDLVAIDDALSALALFDQRKSDVVELRFFGGLTIDETAEVLKISPDTVLRDWKFAKTWLLRELSGDLNGA